MPYNYQEISLLNVTSKRFTYVPNRRLPTWTVDNNILSDAQNGFRRGRSTVDHIFTVNGQSEK